MRRQGGCSISLAASAGIRWSFAKHGSDVEAIDDSLPGLAVVRGAAVARARPVSLHQDLADALPFPDADFDYSWRGM